MDALQKLKELERTTRTPIILDKCSKHDNYEVIVHCDTCSVLLCAKCFVGEHKDHSSRCLPDVITVTKNILEAACKERLVECLEINCMEEMVLANQSSLAAVTSSTKSALEEEYYNVFQQLEQWHSDNLNTLNQCLEETSTACENVLDELHKHRQSYMLEVEKLMEFLTESKGNRVFLDGGVILEDLAKKARFDKSTVKSALRSPNYKIGYRDNLIDKMGRVDIEKQALCYAKRLEEYLNKTIEGHFDPGNLSLKISDLSTQMIKRSVSETNISVKNENFSLPATTDGSEVMKRIESALQLTKERQKSLEDLIQKWSKTDSKVNESKSTVNFERDDDEHNILQDYAQSTPFKDVEFPFDELPSSPTWTLAAGKAESSYFENHQKYSNTDGLGISKGFLHSLPPDLANQASNPDCMMLWDACIVRIGTLDAITPAIALSSANSTLWVQDDVQKKYVVVDINMAQVMKVMYCLEPNLTGFIFMTCTLRGANRVLCQCRKLNHNGSLQAHLDPRSSDVRKRFIAIKLTPPSLKLSCRMKLMFERAAIQENTPVYINLRVSRAMTLWERITQPLPY